MSTIKGLIMLPLYKVAQEYVDLFEQFYLDENPSDELVKTLSDISSNLQDKAINVASYYKNILKEIQAMKENESDMRKKRQTLESKAEWIKTYLKENMEACEIQEIKGPEFSIKLINTKDAVVECDVVSLPINYIKVSVAPDKQKIKEDIKNGKYVDGVSLKDSVRVSIR